MDSKLAGLESENLDLKEKNAQLKAQLATVYDRLEGVESKDAYTQTAYQMYLFPAMILQQPVETPVKTPVQTPVKTSVQTAAQLRREQRKLKNLAKNQVR